jgi:hypothetical protein
MIEFEPQDGVRFVKNVMIEMADGVRVALDMHVPDDGSGDWKTQPQPLLMEYIPYRKDDSAPYSGHHHRLAQNGIIGARLDCRGSGSSEGVATDEYTEREQRDGYEAIEWMAQQPWCTGRIGMFGISYGGFTAVQVAALAPPHLVTIIPVDFTDDRYTDDCHYRGGAMRCYYDIGAYGASMIGMNAMPPYPEYSGPDWARVWEEHLDNNTSTTTPRQQHLDNNTSTTTPRQQHAVPAAVAGTSHGRPVLATGKHPWSVRRHQSVGVHDRRLA